MITRAPFQGFKPVFGLLVLALSLAALSSGCAAGAKAGEPALPPGFQDAGVPDVDVNAYVYVAQESPVALPLKVFGSSTSLAPGTPSMGEVRWMEAFLGPTEEDFGARVRFGDEALARLVDQMLQKAPEGESLWHGAFGPEVRLVRSSAPWAGEARAALEQARTVSVKDKYPDSWEMMRLLPSSAPAAKPVAAGFMRNAAEVARPLLDRQGVEGASVSSALSFAKVDNVAFAVYADRPLRLPDDVTEHYLRSMDVGAVIVAKAGYPGFIASFLFGSFAGRAGLEDAEVKGENVRYRALDGDLHLVVKNFGNVLYFTVGTTRGRAESLMESVLAHQSCCE